MGRLPALPVGPGRRSTDPLPLPERKESTLNNGRRICTLLQRQEQSVNLTHFSTVFLCMFF